MMLKRIPGHICITNEAEAKVQMIRLLFGTTAGPWLMYLSSRQKGTLKGAGVVLGALVTGYNLWAWWKVQTLE